MDDICMRVGFTIRKHREEKGISQESLATLSELHRTYIGQVERGEKNLTLRSLERIANALNVKTKDLL
ncbi:MAG: helix-turn-helix transcriptional regulator [Planctomycetes bacterium]|nr:helix-turn-helix transcriptional regulator [Planctomycetota bacterium]